MLCKESARIKEKKQSVYLKCIVACMVDTQLRIDLLRVSLDQSAQSWSWAALYN